MAVEPLTQAAASRHRRAVERAERALRDLDAAGAVVSFQAVAVRAGVSRQWLYTQPALRAEIERLRDRAPAQTNAVRARQRATEASLRQRIENMRAENHRLREENASLKAELAIPLRSPTASSARLATPDPPASQRRVMTQICVIPAITLHWWRANGR